MAVSVISRSQLAERRRKLKQQRRVRVLQAGWRSSAVLGMAGGLIWLITLPAWVIRSPQQVEIEGNKLLSAQAVQSLLPIPYPRSLLQVQPQFVVQQLEQQAPIADAAVTRRLLPPGLVVQVRERVPVAIADRSGGQSNAASVQSGLLDQDGTWMPLEGYTALNKALQLPTLKVLGMREQYRAQWASLYQTLTTSPVKVSEIDWRQPANLILKTELGIVHCGAYSPQFADQLKALDRMRQLPQKISPSQIAYIDLRNPNAPSIQMIQTINQPESSP